MKKQFAALFLFCFSLQFVDCAHYFNADKRSSGYHEQGHFTLAHVQADRSMGDTENEDRFYFFYFFTVPVDRVNIDFIALDGTNDHDRREYSFSFSSLSKYQTVNSYCGNFPTYVDNLYVNVEYYYNGTKYSEDFYIYSLGKPDQGSGIFEVTTSSIPDEYVDSDGNGVWDSESGLGGVGTSLIKFVKAPYNFLKWLFTGNTQIMLVFSFIIMFLSVFVGLRLPADFAMVMLIPFFIGFAMFLGIVVEGINALGF